MLVRRALWFGRAAGGLVAAAVVLSAAALASPGATERVAKEGGTFRVAFLGGAFTTIDPALVDLPAEGQLLAPACGTLMAYPNKPIPASLRRAPSLAEAEPVVSKDGRTYTFTIRKDARFSSGAPVTARAFERALERVRALAPESVLAADLQDVREVVAKGRTLMLRLRKRPLNLLDAITALCAVPPNLSADPEGARAPLPQRRRPTTWPSTSRASGSCSSATATTAAGAPTTSTGSPPTSTAGFGTAVELVESGTADYVLPAINAFALQTEELARRYGMNKSQFFVRAGAGFRLFHLNTSGPLFRNNPKLRQAVNFAVDRKGIAREGGLYAETPTDQYLLPDTPGYTRREDLPAQGARPDEGKGAGQGPNARRQGCPLHLQEPRRHCPGAAPPAKPEGHWAGPRDHVSSQSVRAAGDTR